MMWSDHTCQHLVGNAVGQLHFQVNHGWNPSQNHSSDLELQLGNCIPKLEPQLQQGLEETQLDNCGSDFN